MKNIIKKILGLEKLEEIKRMEERINSMRIKIKRAKIEFKKISEQEIEHYYIVKSMVNSF